MKWFFGLHISPQSIERSSEKLKAGTEIETMKGAAYWQALRDPHLVCWSPGQDWHLALWQLSPYTHLAQNTHVFSEFRHWENGFLWLKFLRVSCQCSRSRNARGPDPHSKGLDASTPQCGTRWRGRTYSQYLDNINLLPKLIMSGTRKRRRKSKYKRTKQKLHCQMRKSNPGHGEGSESRGVCRQFCWPEFGPWAAHRKEQANSQKLSPDLHLGTIALVHICLHAIHK